MSSLCALAQIAVNAILEKPYTFELEDVTLASYRAAVVQQAQDPKGTPVMCPCSNPSFTIMAVSTTTKSLNSLCDHLGGWLGGCVGGAYDAPSGGCMNDELGGIPK